MLDLNNEGFDIRFKMSCQGHENTSISTLQESIRKGFSMGAKCTVLRETFEKPIIFSFFFQRYQNI